MHHRAIQIDHQPDATIFFSSLSWRLFTAQHVSGVFPPIIKSSMTVVATSGFTLVSWWQSCCDRGQAGRLDHEHKRKWTEYWLMDLRQTLQQQSRHWKVTQPHGNGISSTWGIHYAILSVHGNSKSFQPPSLVLKKVWNFIYLSYIWISSGDKNFHAHPELPWCPNASYKMCTSSLFWELSGWGVVLTTDPHLASRLKNE
jgi:hypothetical protein